MHTNRAIFKLTHHTCFSSEYSGLQFHSNIADSVDIHGKLCSANMQSTHNLLLCIPGSAISVKLHPQEVLAANF